jgi:cytochrome c peroxidase
MSPASTGGAALLALRAISGRGSPGPKPGVNPAPVRLVRPAARPLSEMARIGRDMFFDLRLSVSGKQSCASCHDPAHAYGPPDGRSVQPGGVALRDEGRRAVPGLRYADRTPPFSIGPDVESEDAAGRGRSARRRRRSPRRARASLRGPPPPRP